MFVSFYTRFQKRCTLVAQCFVGWREPMPRSIFMTLLIAALAIFAIEKGPSNAAAGSPNASGIPEFTPDGKLVRPEGYRKWTFLSSGYGMSYSRGSASDQDHLMFTNVFVPSADYDYFLDHGTWPEKTMFVLEIYGSQSKGSINQHGHFQTELM